MAKHRKRKFFLSCLLALSVRSSVVIGVPLPGAYGFGNAKPPQCRNHGIQSRAATAISTSVRESPNNNNDNQSNKKNDSYYCSEFDCIFDSNQVQSKYKHAPDFGIDGNYNPVNGQLFQEALIDHMREFEPRPGTYHGREVDHYLDADTGLNVIVDKNSKRFLSAWKLGPRQLEHVLEHGNLGGG